MSCARENVSRSAEISMTTIFATGAFKYVYKGTYTSGPRDGEPCVAKVFKTGCVYEKSYFDSELKVVAKTLDIVTRFNKEVLLKVSIYVNQPQVWVFSDEDMKGQKTLLEPMIQNFEKFNSNTGWTPNETSPWLDLMQALSHFSYHCTKEEALLCDLQGGVYKNGYILTDPVIMSPARQYGPTDLGSQGISTFFHQHRCNKYCKAHWHTPKDKRLYFRPQKSSSMQLVQVPTRSSRDTLTARFQGLEILEE